MWKTVNYEQVKETGTAIGRCSVCGKKVKRSKVFTHTVNPWNKNEDGGIKTYSEVARDVFKKAKDWEKSEIDFTHKKCKESK